MDIRKESNYQTPAKSQMPPEKESESRVGYYPLTGTLDNTAFDPKLPVGAKAPGAPI